MADAATSQFGQSASSLKPPWRPTNRRGWPGFVEGTGSRLRATSARLRIGSDLMRRPRAGVALVVRDYVGNEQWERHSHLAPRRVNVALWMSLVVDDASQTGTETC